MGEGEGCFLYVYALDVVVAKSFLEINTRMISSSRGFTGA